MEVFMKPVARRNDLVVQEVDGELLIYDLKTKKAYHLTETASFIWKSCDGSRSINDLKEVTSLHFKTQLSDDVVLLALDELHRNDLLSCGFSGRGVSRREVLKKIGAMTAVALPIVASLSIPNTALASLSCVGTPCNIPADCAPPCNCSGGTCI